MYLFKGQVKLDLLEECRYVPSAASRPSYADSIHFKRGGHYVQCISDFTLASDLVCIVVHTKAEIQRLCYCCYSHYILAIILHGIAGRNCKYAQMDGDAPVSE